jgi:hypothetical protein
MTDVLAFEPAALAPIERAGKARDERWDEPVARTYEAQARGDQNPALSLKIPATEAARTVAQIRNAADHLGLGVRIQVTDLQGNKLDRDGYKVDPETGKSRSGKNTLRVTFQATDKRKYERKASAE